LTNKYKEVIVYTYLEGILTCSRQQQIICIGARQEVGVCLDVTF